MAHPAGSAQSSSRGLNPFAQPFTGVYDGARSHQGSTAASVHYDAEVVQERTTQQRTMNAFICTYCGLPTQSNCVHMEKLRRAHTEIRFLKQLDSLHRECLKETSRLLEGQRLLRQASRV